MISINLKTKTQVLEIAKKYKVIIDWDDDPNSLFQEKVSRNRRTLKIKTNLEPSEFDRLFEQHGVNYDIKRGQEMFIFNVLHGIGHFELCLWKPNTGNVTVDRLVNFDQDKKVDKWAYEQLKFFRTITNRTI
ncbi:MAG: hypothetical protein HN981_03390 [Candidatus Pacebacteria bacterium]|jgi:hypothetical protein|nr:hypothetical protein [Candidatus Paceibacterota bacterium]MBT4651960.1 hypothetical protein [Candidatus Paceibacterota bacterium]MBT6755982.1 hypothetical protein [Candidatus Paceibacterota bacterium]MBT6921406.1 hypothetical protein [Candidatus Paceibacterota bacterium]